MKKSHEITSSGMYQHMQDFGINGIEAKPRFDGPYIIMVIGVEHYLTDDNIITIYADGQMRFTSRTG